MKRAVQLFGVFILIAGFTILVAPDMILRWLTEYSDSRVFYFIAILFRLILGAILILSANQSKYPLLLKVLGYIALLAAFIFIIVGHDQFQQFVDSMIPAFAAYPAIGGIAGIAFGILLIYAFIKNKKVES